MESIATHRTLGGYSAQAFLIAFYDHTYPMALETESGLEFRSKSNKMIDGMAIAVARGIKQ